MGAKESAMQILNPIQKILRSLADVFIPLIPVLVATGLFMGLRGFVMQLGLTLSPEVLTLSTSCYRYCIYFLPALVVWSTFRRFGGTPVIGMVLGLMLIAPMLPNAWEVASGAVEPLKVGIFRIEGFQGTILPALIVGIFGAHVEKWIKSWMPSIVDLVFTPFLNYCYWYISCFLCFRTNLYNGEDIIMMGVQSVIELPFWNRRSYIWRNSASFNSYWFTYFSYVN